MATSAPDADREPEASEELDASYGATWALAGPCAVETSEPEALLRSEVLLCPPVLSTGWPSNPITVDPEEAPDLLAWALVEDTVRIGWLCEPTLTAVLLADPGGAGTTSAQAASGERTNNPQPATATAAPTGPIRIVMSPSVVGGTSQSAPSHTRRQTGVVMTENVQIFLTCSGGAPGYAESLAASPNGTVLVTGATSGGCTTVAYHG